MRHSKQDVHSSVFRFLCSGCELNNDAIMKRIVYDIDCKMNESNARREKRRKECEVKGECPRMVVFVVHLRLVL